MTDKPKCTCKARELGQGHHYGCPVASWIDPKDGGYQPCVGGLTIGIDHGIRDDEVHFITDGRMVGKIVRVARNPA